MEHKGTLRLETERLILRPFTMEDTQAMYRNYACDGEVTKYLTWPPHAGVEVTAALLRDWTADYCKPDFYQWAIELRSLGEVIGAISVVEWQPDADAPELGWCLGRRWWGRGLMPEAGRAVVRFLFEEVGVKRITARYDIENPKSGRVMEKLGMSYEGTLRQHGKNNRGIVDEVCYGILRSEFEKGSESPFRPMRRIAQQLSREECEQILSDATSGVLAVYGDGGYPYTVPVSHVYKDGKIYFHCAVSGHKLDAIRRCSKVSFCVIAQDKVLSAERTTAFISVVAFGRARIAGSEEELRYIADLVGKKFSGDYPEDCQAEIDETIASHRLACVEITVEHMTGKCAREIMVERKKRA